MAILEVLKYPDPRLREISKPVEKFSAALKALVEDMFETMYAENGIGLAAPQVGELVQLLVIDTRPRDTGGRYEENQMTALEDAIYKKAKGPLVIINPKVIKGTGKTVYSEGCLSVPSFYDDVERFQVIDLEYQDLEGKTHKVQVDGLLAICVQHEMDHLEGTLFIDHLSLLKSNKIKNQIKKHGYPDRKSREDGDDDGEMEELAVSKSTKSNAGKKKELVKNK